MAIGSKSSNSGDVVLEGRHLIGLFVMMVVIFGVVFVLGYELGRNQMGQQVNAASKTPDVSSAAQPIPQPAVRPTVLLKPGSTVGAKEPLFVGQAPAQSPAPSDWDFYKSGDSQPPDPHLEKPAKTPPASSKPVNSSRLQAQASAKTQILPAASKPAKPQPSLNAPLIPRGSVLLQIAALTRQSDALAMAQVLQQKKFPAVVVPPGADRFFHVQIGPYPDMAAANLARQALENEGFKSIIKR
jgi:cell division septation protein DedD